MKNTYLPVFFAALFALVATHVLLCWYVDPYAIYRDVRVEPVKPYPLSLFYTLRLTKAHQLEQIKPDTVIFGSSRSAMLDPLVLKEGDLTAYNAALPGLTSLEMLAYFRHMTTIARPRRMLLVLDYDAFVADAPRFRKDYDERRLARVPADLEPLGRLRRHYIDFGNTLLSATATRTLTKLFMHRETSGNTNYSDGTWLENARGRATRPTLEGGYEFIVNQYFQELSARRPVSDLSELESLIAESYDLGIELTVLIAPVHGMLLSMYEYAGHDRARQQWQSDVVKLVETEASRHGRAPFAVWGFENNAAVVQSLSEAKRTAPEFDDGLHMSVELGRRVLQEIQGKADGALYGQRLTGQNMPEYLQAVTNRVVAYQHDHPDDIDRLRKKLSLDTAQPKPAP